MALATLSLDQPTLIAYYCKACEKIVKGLSKTKDKRYTFFCPNCDRELMYGTARSLIHYLRIKEHSENGQLLLQIQNEKLASLSSSV